MYGAATNYHSHRDIEHGRVRTDELRKALDHIARRLTETLEHLNRLGDTGEKQIHAIYATTAERFDYEEPDLNIFGGGDIPFERDKQHLERLVRMMRTVADQVHGEGGRPEHQALRVLAYELVGRWETYTGQRFTYSRAETPDTAVVPASTRAAPPNG
jgi:hypothetical protein